MIFDLYYCRRNHGSVADRLLSTLIRKVSKECDKSLDV